MDYKHYLTKLWCKVFLNPNNTIYEKIPEINRFRDRNRIFISGYFVKPNSMLNDKTGHHGRFEEFFFVNRTDLQDFNNSNNKQKYIYPIESKDIISIEMIFDEIEYSK